MNAKNPFIFGSKDQKSRVTKALQACTLASAGFVCNSVSLRVAARSDVREEFISGRVHSR